MVKILTYLFLLIYFFNQDLFGHNPDAPGGGIFFTNPTLDEVQVIFVNGDELAMEGVASGIYDALDSNFNLKYRYYDLNDPENEYNAKCLKILEPELLELRYNHYSPIWGMNAHDPREMYAETDKWDNSLQIRFLTLSIAGILIIAFVTGFFLKKRI